MSEQISEATAELFQKAHSGDVEAYKKITAILTEAVAAGTVWPTVTKQMFQNGLNAVASTINGKAITEPQGALLRAAMAADMDTVVLRDRYSALAKMDFKNYQDPAGLVEALGVRDGNIPLLLVRRRWHLMEHLQVGAICFDNQMRRGTIVEIEDLTNQLTIQMKSERKIVQMSAFLRTFVIVRKDSTLAQLLLTGKNEGEQPGVAYRKKLEDDILRASSLPADFLRKILVPDVMTENHFKNQILGVSGSTEEKKSHASAPKAPLNRETSLRWDDSRSVLELSERLKNCDNLQVEGEPHLDSVKTVLERGASVEEQAEKFATAVALLQKLGDAKIRAWLAEIAKELSEKKVAIWSNQTLWCTVSNDLPGKIAVFWFEVTLPACGADWLATACLKLPYRLWASVEKTLIASGEKELLGEKVVHQLSGNRGTADMLYWLWRSKLTEAKNKFLSDSALIFKVLHQEVKGTYLKAQRDLKKLLLEDEDFQEQVMLNGDHDAVIELIRCVKHLPLLDLGEVQAILVRINELHPEFIHDIEEKRDGKIADISSIGRKTSIRGYNRRKAELDRLVNVDIPANSERIRVAREHGDLSENSEYKYAKEDQAKLGARQREYERSLDGMITTDFRDVQVTNVVIPGCTVVVQFRDEHEETYHILGMLDTESEKSIIAYDSPLGKVLVFRETGDRITMPTGDKATIKEVRPLSAELLEYVKG